MKKILLTLAILGGAAFTSFAQSNTHEPKTSIGFEAGIPVGTFTDIYSVVLGGSLKYEAPIASNAMFTITGGYTALLYTKLAKDMLNDTEYANKSAEGYVPIKGGLKAYINNGFYVEGQIGVAITTISGGNNSFIYSPGIGYSGKGGDIGFRYEGWTNHGNTFGQIAVRAAISFK